MDHRSVRWGVWVPLAIVVVTVLAYLNALGNPFLFDDEEIIVNNPDIQRVFPISVAPRWLVNLTFKLNYATGALRVADYHATNILIHVLAALVLFGVVRRTLLMPRMGAAWSSHAAMLSGVVALLWAVHPLQTQSVTYICQRYESMMGLLYLATLYAFMRGVQAVGRNRMAGWYGLSVGLCLLGMGAKEIMVTAPLVLLLYDDLFVASSWREVVRKRLGVHAGLWGSVLVFAVLQRQVVSAAAQAGTGVTLGVTWWSYLLTQMEVIPHYLRLSIVPFPLCLDYAWPFVSAWREVVWPGVIVVGLGLGTLWLMVRRHPAAFTGVWFFAILAPTSSVISLPDAAFEHRMYLPLAAVIAAVVLGVYRGAMARGAGGRPVFRSVALVMVGLLVIGATGMTHLRNRVYRSPLTMWQDVVKTRPQNVRARLNLSSALLTAGRYEAARSEAGAVVEQLAACAGWTAADVPLWGRTPEEVVIYRDARYYALAHNLMGVASIRQGRAEVAEQHFEEAVRLLPQFADAARNLEQVRREKKSPAEAGLSN